MILSQIRGVFASNYCQTPPIFATYCHKPLANLETGRLESARKYVNTDKQRMLKSKKETL